MHLTSSLDVLDNVVGDHALEWSADHCIAAATSRSVILYQLNPLEDPGCPTMSFKVQVIEAGKPIEYDTGVRKMLDAYDELRLIPSKTAAAPNFDVYKTHLDPSLMQLYDGPHSSDSGYRSVGFSPLNCAIGGGTVLATLTMGHRLQIYARTSDGTSIQWSKILDLSDMLVNILQENNGYYPGIEFPALSENAQKMWEKQYAAYITCFAWCHAVMQDDNSEDFILFVTCTKNNFAVLWRMDLPLCKDSKISLLNSLKTPASSCKCVEWMRGHYLNHGMLAVGSSDGTITCFKVNLTTGQCVAQNSVWSHKDELTVTGMQWDESDGGSGESGIIASKGCIVLYQRISKDLRLLSYTHLKGAHILPITNISSFKEHEWLTTSLDGCVMRVVLQQPSADDSNLSLDFEVLEKSSIVTPSLLPQTTHFAAVSPNHAFLAKICSKPKISATVQIENSGYIEIKTLQNGVTSFNSLLSHPDWCVRNMHPQTDLLESLRLHVVGKDLEMNESDVLLLQKMLLDFAKSKTPYLQMKWLVLKMLSESALPLPEYETNLQELEKRIVIQQMIKILKMWFDHGSGKARSPPVRTILKWLHGNEQLIGENDLSFLTKVRKSQKFVKSKAEMCSVTGESLSMSPDARFAYTKESGVRWFRCCLTFCALQEYKTRKCELSNSRALLPVENDNAYMKILLKEPSIYSACTMI